MTRLAAQDVEPSGTVSSAGDPADSPQKQSSSGAFEHRGDAVPGAAFRMPAAHDAFMPFPPWHPSCHG